MTNDSIVLSPELYRVYYCRDFGITNWYFLINDSHIENLYNDNKISFTFIKKFLIINRKTDITLLSKIYFNSKEEFLWEKDVSEYFQLILTYEKNNISKKEIAKLKLKYMI